MRETEVAVTHSVGDETSRPGVVLPPALLDRHRPRCGGPRRPIRGADMDVAGKVALLTGGARIGQTVAQALAQRGCGLALTYRSSRDTAEATAAAAGAAGVRTVVLRAD